MCTIQIEAFWRAANAARGLTGSEDRETIAATVEDIVGPALYAPEPIRRRALDLLEALAVSPASAVLRSSARDALEWCSRS